MMSYLVKKVPMENEVAFLSAGLFEQRLRDKKVVCKCGCEVRRNIRFGRGQNGEESFFGCSKARPYLYSSDI